MTDDTAGGLADLDFAEVSPQEFAQLVQGMTGKEINEAMRGALRARVLDEVFARMGRQFRAENAGSLTALIRWRITGDPETVYETALADGACVARAGASDADPRVTLTLSDAEFLKLASGNASPITMFMTRKLRITGDLQLASGLTRLFDIPKA